MSKKSYFKIAFIIAALSCIAVSSAHAAETKLITGSLQIGGGTFSPSNKVSIQVAVGPASCDPTNATNTCSGYAAKSKHGSGDRVFATNNKDPKVYYKTVAVTTTLETVSYSEEFTASPWVAM